MDLVGRVFELMGLADRVSELMGVFLMGIADSDPRVWPAVTRCGHHFRRLFNQTKPKKSILMPKNSFIIPQKLFLMSQNLILDSKLKPKGEG